MTSGGGIPIDATSNAGKSALTLLKKHLDKLQTSKNAFNNNIAQCSEKFMDFVYVVAQSNI